MKGPRNESSRSKLAGYQNVCENSSQRCHPRMFLSGVPVLSVWIPDRSFGNDGDLRGLGMAFTQ